MIALRPLRWLPICIVFGFAFTMSAVARSADEFEEEPILYSQSTPDNRVSQLQAKVDRGEAELKFQPNFGYLPALLEALQISPESQALVFSKTSLQQGRIRPKTPRALYFNDDVYIGYCHNGDVIEISVADPQLGAVFYTLDQNQAPRPQLQRQTDRCLLCHASGRTQYTPGHLARSLFVSSSGQPILSEGSKNVDHTTPIEDRWGGWYVSGQHGSQKHLGNLIIQDRDAPRPFNNDAGQNVTDLSKFFRTSDYLTPHSDIVALMVLEHQLLVHNLITHANFTARRSLDYEVKINRQLGEPENQRRESTTSRLKNAADKLVEGLLFSREAPITAPISGTSKFAEQFAGAGPRDSHGRSLRDFDLQTRMFKYPCSYLIYSAAFDALPEAMKTHVAERLHEVFTSTATDADAIKAFAHLSPQDRQAILEILTQTKPDFWKYLPQPVSMHP